MPRGTAAAVFRPPAPIVVQLGEGRRYDCTDRALVMGILNRTPDSFFDAGAYFDFDRFLLRAEQLVEDGADVLDVGGVKAGVGPPVSTEEELERIVPAVTALRARFSIPISVDTWNAAVVAAAFAAGASVGNDISGFSDPSYLPAAAAAAAAVVATHIRLAPRVLDPSPAYDDVCSSVENRLVELARRARDAGLSAESVLLDPGLDLGKTTAHSLQLLRDSARFAALGHPLFLAASNKDFLGELLGLDVSERRDATMAAIALGITRGCRIVRVHDVAGARRVVDTLAPILAAGRRRAEEEPETGPCSQLDGAHG